MESLLGPVDAAREEVAELMGRGVRTKMTVALPPEAETHREEVRPFVARYKALPKEERRKVIDRW